MLRSSRSSRGTNPCHELALLLPALSGACCTQCNESALTMNTQTNSNPFLRSSHPRNNRSSRCIRPLLQALSALHPHTNIRHHPCHLSRPHPSPGSLLLYSSCIIYHPRSCALGFSLLIPRIAGRKPSEYPPSTTHLRRNRKLLLAHPSAQVLATAPAAALAFLASIERSHYYCLQRWTYSGWYNMAHSAWLGINCIRRRLESG